MNRTRRRRGARVRVRHPAFFETPGYKGTAVVREISYSGARLEADEPLPALRATVQLYIWPAGQAEPFVLVGAVVGRREDGFAVEYEEVGQHTCQMIDLLHAAASADGQEAQDVQEDGDGPDATGPAAAGARTAPEEGTGERA